MKIPQAFSAHRKVFAVWKRSLVPALALGLTLASVDASVTLFPPDALSSDWTTSRYGNPLVETTTLHGEEWLKISRTGSNNGSAQVVYTGEGSALGDFKGSVILGTLNTSSYAAGVILRAGGTGYTSGASYFLAVVPNSSSTSTLGLYYGGGETFLPPNGTSTWQTLDSVALSARMGTLDATSNQQYLLEFSFVGEQFNAALYIWDTVANEKGDVLGTLNYTEEDLTRATSGYFGLRGGRYGANVDSYFRALEVQAIPEPSTAAMIGIAVGGLMIYRKHYRR